MTRVERFEEAAEYFQTAAKWHSGDQQETAKERDEMLSKLYYNSATAYVQVGQGEKALEMYKQVLETEHGASKWAIYNSMGLLYYDFEEDEQAISSFEQALELESDHPSVLRNLAGVYLRRHNATAALPLLRISAVRDPSSFEAWYYLGGAYSQLNRHRDAAYAFGNATLLKPNHTDARRFWGEECAQADDLACAVSQLKEAARVYGLRSLYGGCNIFSALGATYMELGMLIAAKQTFQAVLQRCDCSNHPEPAWCARDPLLLADLGMAELALGDGVAANASLSAALELDEGLVSNGIMADLLLARAMAGDVAAAPAAQQLFWQGQWIGGTPEHLVMLGIPAAGYTQLAAEFVAQRRELAAEALVPAVLAPVSAPGVFPSLLMGAGGADSAPGMRVGFLVCSTALRGADMQALKQLLLVVSMPEGGAFRGGLEAIVYDWCVVGASRGHLQQKYGQAGSTQGQAGSDAEDADEEGEMSVMEELAADAGTLANVREGSVGYQAAQDAARIINGDGVHVLVALDGWHAKNRNSILFHRPCAVQVSALGHRASMADAEAGSAPMTDAFIAGRVSAPPEHASHFSEGLLLLPLGYMPPCPTRAVAGAQPGHFTFTSLPAMSGADNPTTQRRAARAMLSARKLRDAASEAGESAVMSVVGPVEAISLQALRAWGAALSASSERLKISLPALPEPGRRAIVAEIAAFGSPAAGLEGRVPSAGGAAAPDLDTPLAGWHVDAAGEQALNTSMRLYASDAVLDTWRVSAGRGLPVSVICLPRPALPCCMDGCGAAFALLVPPVRWARARVQRLTCICTVCVCVCVHVAGPLVGKAVALERPVLTLPLDTMASRTGAEHAVALGCHHCGIARSAEDAARYATALARR